MVTQENDAATKPKQSLFRRVFGRKETPDERPETQSAEPATPTPDESLQVEILETEILQAEDLDAGGLGLAAAQVEREDQPDAEIQPEIAPRAAPPGEPPAPMQKRSWWARLREGLARSSNSIGSGLIAIFTKRKLDESMLDDLEDVLIRADLGVATAARIAKIVGKGRYDRNVEVDEVKAILAAEVERVLSPYARPLEIDAEKKPYVILVVGVNGSGKTTTIGKIAAKFSAEGRRVLLAAGDTFRAAAIEQLMIWGQRLHCPVISREQGADASALAFDAIKAAQERGDDVVLMDTAGRLQNRTELMAELEKIIRVMKKVDATAPHAVLLVLDATVGQNAMSQVEIFGRVAGVTGLVMTKLDGTARGGILVAIADKFQLPVHFIGIGETADDLEAFTARDFARAIAGIED
ncbi:signal recognition particle-docking protein FtsY [Methylocapsa polymorpha]|uniref:Signal recognition particle receptor FtsY n=1 Tax=Methylocapsa polymorpha TaxID=3080828 RepID=A0ABZ0HUW2_9HYPH|nr:signal recognition particle-docking protein FtsY [Methylocapsa sp. RX1]